MDIPIPDCIGQILKDTDCRPYYELKSGKRKSADETGLWAVNKKKITICYDLYYIYICNKNQMSEARGSGFWSMWTTQF